MTVHDQLFKELLEARLGDFLEIVVPQPLAWALAALMRPPANWSPARHLLACLAPITESETPWTKPPGSCF